MTERNVITAVLLILFIAAGIAPLVAQNPYDSPDVDSPYTAWSRVDLEVLRRHLIDMHEFR
jgi:hypothetical protein